MVFYTNWDDSGLGFLFSGWNCCYPCPYLTDESFPSNFRWAVIDEGRMKGKRKRIVAIKEPGPGFPQCLAMMLPPYVLTLPCWLYKTKATSLNFVKQKNDHVQCDYREKSLCFERSLLLEKVTNAYVEEFEMAHRGGTKEIVYILCVKHARGIFEYHDIALSNQRWKENAQSLAETINKLIASRPF